jgi:hypothetical protein
MHGSRHRAALRKSGESAFDCGLRVAQRRRGSRRHHRGEIAERARQEVERRGLIRGPGLARGEPVQRHRIGPRIARHAHALARVVGAARLADLRIGRAQDRVGDAGLDGERGARRRRVVVVGRAGARPRGQIELRRLPWGEAAAACAGRPPVAGAVEGLDRRLRHRAVMAVLAGHVEEARHQRVGAVGADRAHELLDHALAAPHRERRLGRLGEAEVAQRAFELLVEPIEVDAQHLRCRLHLERAQHAERGAGLRPDRVLPAFAAQRAGIADPRPVAEREPRQQRARLVVGMGAGLQKAVHAGKALERAP